MSILLLWVELCNVMVSMTRSMKELRKLKITHPMGLLLRIHSGWHKMFEQTSDMHALREHNRSR